MKKSKRMFILIEAVLAVMAVLVVAVMIKERNGRAPKRIAAVLQNSDDGQWSAFKYGLKSAAKDQNVDVFIVGKEGPLGVEEERLLLEREIENGADALIVQPVIGDGSEEMLQRIGKKVPVMLVEYPVSETRETSSLPVASADHEAMGRDLGAAFLEDCGGNLQGKTIGFVSETEDSEAARCRKKGFLDAIDGCGGMLAWSISASKESGVRPGEQEAVDFIIALDDSSLIEAGKEAMTNDLHGAVVYGIGNSTEAVYYLDLGKVECLVVPDEFYTGYQSLTEVAKRLGSRFYKMKNRTVSHTVLRRKELFSEENQRLIFTMSQ